MATYKDYHITVDTKRQTKVALHNIISGENGIRLYISPTDDGTAINLSSSAVQLVIKSELGERTQDSRTDSNITAAGNTCTVLLSKDSFTSGMNRCTLKIFTTNTSEYDTEVCTAEFHFVAK
jgi:hypothetical protein